MNSDSNLASFTDKALAKLAKEGSRDAFEELYNRYLPVVVNHLYALLPEEAVQRVAQEVFVTAVQRIKWYWGWRSFRAWITALVRRKIAVYYRGQSTKSEETLTYQETGELEPSPIQVRRVLRHLPVHYQEVILLRFAERIPFRQIADTLGVSLDMVESRYFRAVEMIASELQTSGTQRPEESNRVSN